MSLTRWCVWNDWANAEHLAVEADQMTPALQAALAQERTEVRTVEAEDRRAAVRVAFPEVAQAEQARAEQKKAGPVPSVEPVMRPRRQRMN